MGSKYGLRNFKIHFNHKMIDKTRCSLLTLRCNEHMRQIRFKRRVNLKSIIIKKKTENGDNYGQGERRDRPL
jgi:hypothetical protein